jgi:hypothetical protein
VFTNPIFYLLFRFRCATQFQFSKSICGGLRLTHCRYLSTEMIDLRWAASNALPAIVFKRFGQSNTCLRDAHDALHEYRSIGCLVSDPESRRPKHDTPRRDAHDALHVDRSIGCLVSDPESRRPKHDTPRRDAHDALLEDRSIGCLVSDPESRRPKHYTPRRDAHDALLEDRSIECLVSDPESRRLKHDSPRRDAHDALPEDRSIFDHGGMRITHCQRLMLNNLSKNMPLGPLAS